MEKKLKKRWAARKGSVRRPFTVSSCLGWEERPFRLTLTFFVPGSGLVSSRNGWMRRRLIAGWCLLCRRGNPYLFTSTSSDSGGPSAKQKTLPAMLVLFQTSVSILIAPRGHCMLDGRRLQFNSSWVPYLSRILSKDFCMSRTLRRELPLLIQSVSSSVFRHS